MPHQPGAGFGTPVSLGFRFTDTDEDFTLRLRNSILEVQPRRADDVDARVETTRQQFNQLFEAGWMPTRSRAPRSPVTGGREGVPRGAGRSNPAAGSEHRAALGPSAIRGRKRPIRLPCETRMSGGGFPTQILRFKVRRWRRHPDGSGVPGAGGFRCGCWTDGGHGGGAGSAGLERGQGGGGRDLRRHRGGRIRGFADHRAAARRGGGRADRRHRRPRRCRRRGRAGSRRGCPTSRPRRSASATPIVDDWEGKVNAWPLDEGLIDYVDASYGGATDENPYAALNVIGNPKLDAVGRGDRRRRDHAGPAGGHAAGSRRDRDRTSPPAITRSSSCCGART